MWRYHYLRRMNELERISMVEAWATGTGENKYRVVVDSESDEPLQIYWMVKDVNGANAVVHEWTYTMYQGIEFVKKYKQLMDIVHDYDDAKVAASIDELNGMLIQAIYPGDN